MMKNIKDEVRSKHNKSVYAGLCNYPHASIQRLKRVLKAESPTKLLIHYTPEYNEVLAQYYFDQLFVLTDGIFEDYVSVLTFKDKPSILKNYFNQRKLFYTKYNGKNLNDLLPGLKSGVSA